MSQQAKNAVTPIFKWLKRYMDVEKKKTISSWKPKKSKLRYTPQTREIHLKKRSYVVKNKKIDFKLEKSIISVSLTFSRLVTQWMRHNCCCLGMVLSPKENILKG